eukprot:c24625_g4_i1 orf=77-964(+)
MENMELDSSSSSSCFTAGAATDVPLLLDGKDDRYGGFIVDPGTLPAHESSFLCALRNSLALWRSQLKKGIWLKLPIEKARLVPIAVEEGFQYHHAETDYVMLTLWIPRFPSTLPANASHQVGVGAIVINERNEILVVQEIAGPTKGSGVWKMPTGVVGQGENVRDAVTRRVREETGIETEFCEVFGVRQAHDQAFGKSDLFFLCKLRLLSLQEIVIQESKVATAKWMHLNEFRSQPFNSASTFLTRVADIATASLAGEYKGFDAEVLAFGFRNKGSYFYHNIRDVKEFLERRMRA